MKDPTDAPETNLTIGADGARASDPGPQPGERFVEVYLRPGFAADKVDIAWSGRNREWFHEGFYHCLPLQLANQVGWCVLCPEDFSVIWNGRPDPSSLTVGGCRSIISYFGHGIFTYTPPFVFRTPPGINLLVKAVPNLPKDGVCPLEGFIEMDNLKGSFTFNFRITRPAECISYKKGEPLAQILPYPRGWIETFEPRVLVDGPRYDEHMKEVLRMEELRRTNIEHNEPGVKQRDWRYFRGEHLDGARFPSHQKKLALRGFVSPQKDGIAGPELVEELRRVVSKTERGERAYGPGQTLMPAPAARPAETYEKVQTDE
jgi:hypothetical protein